MTIESTSQLAWQWLEELAQCSETAEPDREGVTRLCATKEHTQALELLTGYMQQSGMTTHINNAGNLIGRYSSQTPNAKTLIFGSHQDTVPNGGKYDGILGVVLPIALVHYFNQQGTQLPYNIDVIAFSDEEGTRFQSTLLGSKAIAGTFEPSMLDSTDRDGVSLQQALTDFGCQPELIHDDAYSKEDVIGFVEVHIEQGPQLESAGLPVGVVSAITGIERHTLSIVGKAGHAGTVPMNARQDALVGAAQVISSFDALCKSDKDLVGVVGKISNFPNGVNVIPQQTDITIELRSPIDSKRVQAREQLLSQIDTTLNALNLNYTHSQTYEQQAVTCSEELSQRLVQSIESCGIASKVMFSGAGHDGLAMCELTDIAMLFVRCKDGVSHHPDESILQQDLLVSLQVLEHFCQSV
ncbi:M20 family metallo-hydrolase [Vibrio superstes]|uniref:Zn-dependent hydrolase n=1 Tax=Vibrio superstes NBRC 103154 TaxID=1219062 RepID=A0A511QW68_9VIBR|nr:M20 family metallo-hydrolase [Vibrio superstes]GEM81623.1 Zn-dependent hydrolase [Vibrio superstes NBRC 103154]